MTRLGARWLLACLGTWGGCSAGLTGYVAEQAWGQLRIMHQRRPIREVLRRPALSADWRVKLELVLLVRDYAHEELGLRRSGAYTYFYDTGGKPLAYNLSACPPDSLRPRLWRFPVVGALPYLGFFRRAEGVARQQVLKAEGLDTYLRPVPAFSSLGWFADPVYSPLLQEEIPRLIDVVIHETTHTTIFLRGQVAFNESLAMFIGSQGTLNLLARMYGPASDEVRRHVGSIDRQKRFARLVSALYRQLERLYAGPLPRAEKLRRRQALFARAQRQYRQIVPDPARQGSFGRRRLNNAVLLSYGRYNQGIEFHRQVYLRLGRDLARLVALYKRAQLFDDPIAYVERVTGVVRTTGQQM